MVDWTSGTAYASVADRDVSFLPLRVSGSPDVFKETPVSTFLAQDVAGNYSTPAGSGASVKVSYSSASVSSRSWRFKNDVNSYGDFSIQQSTTQTGNVWLDQLYFGPTGNIGLGTLTPLARLHVNNPAAAAIQSIIGNAVGGGVLQVRADGSFDIGGFASRGMRFGSYNAGGTFLENAQFDSAGRLGIGGIAPSMTFHVSSTDQTAARIRLSNTGTSGRTYDIVSGVPSVSQEGFCIFDVTAGITRLQMDINGHFSGGSDNAQTLGTAGRRWSVVYAGSGTINTSDEREKKYIGEVPDAWLDAWSDVQWSRFKMKGGNRWHIGLVSQQVHAAFAAHDIDAFEIGLCCFDEWQAEDAPVLETVKKSRKIKRDTGELTKTGKPITETVDEEFEELVDTGKKQRVQEAGDIWGLRYDECQAIEAAWQRRELARMAARIAALEA